MLTRTLKQPSPPSTQSGFTIVECLLAIIIVTLLMTAIAPVIALSVATRLQARRVEVATQAARSYVDGVRGGTIDPPEPTVRLRDVNPRNQQFAPKRENFAQNPAPTSRVLNCQENKYCQPPSLGLYCFDVDGGGCTSNSSRDMVVQAFRSSATNPRSDTGKNGYLLAVRVYRADAFDGRGNLLKMADTNRDLGGRVERSQLTRTYAGGSGNRKAPLVEMTTEISGEGTNYETLCERLGGCK